MLKLLGQLADLISKLVYTLVPTPEERKRKRKLAIDAETEEDRKRKQPSNSFWKGK